VLDAVLQVMENEQLIASGAEVDVLPDPGALLLDRSDHHRHHRVRICMTLHLADPL
jgi:hypothetical protein